MTSLERRVEMVRLARVLDVEDSALACLDRVGPEGIRTLRTAYNETLFTRYEKRFRRIAKVAASVPAPLAARIAQVSLGPSLAARVAAVMDPPTAAKLASSLSTDYLADVSVALDPVRASAVLDGIDVETIIAVGKILLERAEHVALGRFVSVIGPETALEVVAGASGGALLQVALYADDDAALDVLVQRIGQPLLTDAINAAHLDRRYEDAITLVARVSAPSRERLISLIADLEPDARDGFIRAIHAHDAWESVLPSLASLDDTALAAISSSPAAREPGVLPRLERVAHEMDLDALVNRLSGLLDEGNRTPSD